MGLDSVCFTEKLTFLHYINENYLVYALTILTFASLYGLVCILGKYTHFEKLKLARASLPSFPYGNFKDVIKQNTSLHVYLWKYYNRFKRKNCKYGGMFVFMKPVVLITDNSVSTIFQTDDGNNNQFEAVIPEKSILKSDDLQIILNSDVLRDFVKIYNSSLKGALPEMLLNEDPSSTFKNFLLEVSCAAFGFKPFEMIDEINQILNTKYETSLRFYLSICLPFLKNKHTKLQTDLQEIFMEIVESRKKNELDHNDLVESFISLYNYTNYSIGDISNELFSCFADILTFSYSVLMMSLYELAASNEIQEEFIGEVRRFNKKYKQITSENLEELVYVDAVIKETLRKYPPIATIITSSNSGTLFDWYKVKKGVFFQSTLALQRDPDIYTKPEEFDPDRFVESRNVGKDVFAPFGTGPAADLRTSLVILHVKLILSSIFSCLGVKIKDGASRSFKYNPRVWYLTPNEDFQFEFVRIP